MNSAVQRAEAPRPNNTGLPDNLKSGIESLSGFSMDDVLVHYNSSKPATVQALAYTQGTDIHVAPGQEKCLPHEAWHVAQQMAGRVSPTTNVNGMPVNDNAALEHEADVMGEKAVQCKEKIHGCRNYPINEISLIQSASQSAYQRYADVIQKADEFDDLVEFIVSYFVNGGKAFNGIYNEAVKRFKPDHPVKKKLLLFWQNNCGRDDFGNVCDTIKNLANEDKQDELKEYFIRNLGEIKSVDSSSETDLANAASEDEKKLEKKRFEENVNVVFETGAQLLCEIVKGVLLSVLYFRGEGFAQQFDVDYFGKYKNRLMSFFLSDDMICYDKEHYGKRGNIWKFVEAQINEYAGRPARQVSVMVLGVARKIAYMLGDPWAENRIARLLNKKIESEFEFCFCSWKIWNVSFV